MAHDARTHAYTHTAYTHTAYTSTHARKRTQKKREAEIEAKIDGCIPMQDASNRTHLNRFKLNRHNGVGIMSGSANATFRVFVS